MLATILTLPSWASSLIFFFSFTVNWSKFNPRDNEVFGGVALETWAVPAADVLCFLLSPADDRCKQKQLGTAGGEDLGDLQFNFKDPLMMQ